MPRLGPRGGGGHSGFPTQPSFWWGSWTSVQREKRFIVSGMGFSPGFSNPALKRMIKSTLSRNAEALLPPAEAGGSHQSKDYDSDFQTSLVLACPLLGRAPMLNSSRSGHDPR
jgi:hypothetical protein